MNIVTKKDLITKLLSDHPHLRDDDYQLISEIWGYETLALHTDNSIAQFLTDFGNGKYTNPESIRRCRAKLQETMPELRGDKYYKRHRHQSDVIDQLNNF